MMLIVKTGNRNVYGIEGADFSGSKVRQVETMKSLIKAGLNILLIKQ